MSQMNDISKTAKRGQKNSCVKSYLSRDENLKNCIGNLLLVKRRVNSQKYKFRNKEGRVIDSTGFRFHRFCQLLHSHTCIRA